MDSLSRLIVWRRFTLAAFLVVWSHAAYAEWFEYRIVNGWPFQQTTGWSGSKSEACNALKEMNQAADPNRDIIEWRITGTDPSCSMNRVVTSTGEVVAQGGVSYESRPGVGNPPGFCKGLVDAANGGGGSFSTPVVSDPPPLKACASGCLIEGSYSGSSGSMGTVIWGPYKDLGLACSSAPAAPSTLPPGRCPGQVNGVDVPGGVPCGTTTTPPRTTTTPAPSDPASAPAGAPPGSTTTTTTTCGVNSCNTTTTTTTTTAPAGSGSGSGSGGSGSGQPPGTTQTTTETTTESKDSFCSKNPADPQCKKPDPAFGGSCDATTCSGDAVECAIAREQYKRNCELFNATDASARGLAAATAGDQPGDHPGAHKSVVELGTFDQTNILPGGCPPDVAVPVSHFGSVTLPFSKLCGPAETLGNVLVAITALACIGIVFVRGS